MPVGVIYTDRKAAQAYADEVGGQVVAVDSDGDGENDGWKVEPVERATRGLTAKDVEQATGSSAAAAEHAAFLRDVERGGSPRGETEDPMAALDEFGYRQGGMSFTERGPISYSKGGAVKGKTFRGSF